MNLTIKTKLLLLLTLYPPKLSNCGNLTYLTYLFPKYPQHNFFKKKKKIQKKTKKQETGGRPPPMGWFGHPSIYLYIFLGFFFGIFFLEKRKKKVLGAFWE
jgi:hypothetical protein